MRRGCKTWCKVDSPNTVPYSPSVLHGVSGQNFQVILFVSKILPLLRKTFLRLLPGFSLLGY
jgi:hypothetical protein